MTSFGCQTLLNLKTFSAICLSFTLVACGGGGGGTSGDSFAPTPTTNAKPQSSVETASSQSSSLDSVGEIPQTSSSSSNTTSKSSSSKTTSSKRSSSAGTIDTTAPTAPAELLGSPIYNRVALSWSPASDNVGVVYYRIYRDQALIDTLWAPEDSYIDYDVAPSRTYTYSISAGDAVNNWSLPKSLLVTTPSAPVQSNSSASTSSKANTTSSHSSSNSSLNSSSSSSSVGNSSTGTTSSKSSSKSSSSASSKVVDSTSPSMPTVKQDGAFSTHVDLSWTASTDNLAVTSYKIYRDGVVIATLDDDVLSYSDTSVQANRQYLYGVSAGDAAGNWSAQKTLLVNTPSSTVSGDITLVWLSPIKRENGNSLSLGELSGYELRYKRQIDENYTYISLSKLTLLYVIPALSGDYQFELAAIDNNQLYSEFKSLTPQ